MGSLSSPYGSVEENIIIRHLRVRGSTADGDAIQLSEDRRVILDHVDCSHSTDECIDFWGGATLISVQWSAMAAAQGNANGQFLLGQLYRDGIGVTKDEKVAAAAPLNAAKARRLTSLTDDWRRAKTDDWRRADQDGEIGASVTSGVACIPDVARLSGARRKSASSGHLARPPPLTISGFRRSIPAGCGFPIRV